MKKHTVSCPKCQCSFEYSPPTIKRQSRQKETYVFSQCVDFWLKTFHKGWSFGCVNGKHLKDILKKLKGSLDESRVLYSERLHIETFKHLCYNLPEFFKDKDLAMINSKYNEIIEQLKQAKINGNKWHSKNSSDRYSEAASRYKA